MLQLFINGIISGCAYAFVALGFALIYNTTRIFHFAHGAVYVCAAYLFYTFWYSWSLPLSFAVIITLCLTAVFGVLVDELIYIPLLKRKSPLLIQLLSSLSVYAVIVNFIALIYGNETKQLSTQIQQTYIFGSFLLTQTQIATALCFVLVIPIIFIILRKTHLGMMFRALRDDSDLFSAMGFNQLKVRRIVFALGSALAAIGAILMTMNVGTDPNAGMVAIFNGIVAVIIGGVAVFEGAVLGAFLLGILQSLIVWQTSDRWQILVTFAVLTLLLIFRPQGILGSRRRVEEIAI